MRIMFLTAIAVLAAGPVLAAKEKDEGGERTPYQIVESAPGAAWRAVDPENTDAHEHLYAYYYGIGYWPQSYSHLEPLIRITPNDISLLERAADLNMKMDRIDRALQYYEYGLAVDPVNGKLITGKERAQKKLAADLLSLVENDGGKKLWQDLVRVAPDCAGVYREIAILLREKGKVDELIEVLTLLNKQDPDDQLIYEELAALLEQQGMSDQLSALREGRGGISDADKNSSNKIKE